MNTLFIYRTAYTYCIISRQICRHNIDSLVALFIEREAEISQLNLPLPPSPSESYQLRSITYPFNNSKAVPTFRVTINCRSRSLATPRRSGDLENRIDRRRVHGEPRDSHRSSIFRKSCRKFGIFHFRVSEHTADRA